MARLPGLPSVRQLAALVVTILAVIPSYMGYNKLQGPCEEVGLPCRLGDKYADPQDCTMYYLCGNDGLELTRESCRNGKLFDIRVNKCRKRGRKVKCSRPCNVTIVVQTTPKIVPTTSPTTSTSIPTQRPTSSTTRRTTTRRELETPPVRLSTEAELRPELFDIIETSTKNAKTAPPIVVETVHQLTPTPPAGNSRDRKRLPGNGTDSGSRGPSNASSGQRKETKQQTEDEQASWLLPVIIGCAVGGALIIIFIGFVVAIMIVRRRRREKMHAIKMENPRYRARPESLEMDITIRGHRRYEEVVEPLRVPSKDDIFARRNGPLQTSTPQRSECSTFKPKSKQSKSGPIQTTKYEPLLRDSPHIDPDGKEE